MKAISSACAGHILGGGAAHVIDSLRRAGAVCLRSARLGAIVTGTVFGGDASGKIRRTIVVVGALRTDATLETLGYHVVVRSAFEADRAIVVGGTGASAIGGRILRERCGLRFARVLSQAAGGRAVRIAGVHADAGIGRTADPEQKRSPGGGIDRVGDLVACERRGGIGGIGARAVVADRTAAVADLRRAAVRANVCHANLSGDVAVLVGLTSCADDRRFYCGVAAERCKNHRKGEVKELSHRG